MELQLLLEEDCRGCKGCGKVDRLGDGYFESCDDCNGRGKTPTKSGRELLGFIAHHMFAEQFARE